MSKKQINEMNVLSRFFGDVFDNLRQGTADRLIKKIKARKFPPDVIKSLEKIKKDRDDLARKIEKYNKDAKRYNLKQITRENKK